MSEAGTPIRNSSHRKRVAVLGCTGSVGTSTLDVVRHMPERFKVVGLCANSQWQKLAELCHEFRPRIAILCDPRVRSQVDFNCFPRETQILFGTDRLLSFLAEPEIEIVIAAIVGVAGLMGTWAALETGKTVALANKESLVVAGPLIMDLAARRGAKLLPVDSEHSAIFQALAGSSPREVERIVLTASGGPFRGRTADQLKDVTVEQALDHPTWKMGAKITIDSATMMNKALEMIEARWLFDVPAEKIDVVVHPGSVVHSFVEFVDGSIIAQLSPPDMRLPIQLAMTYPERLSGPTQRLDWRTLRELRFEQPDRETFPALELGAEVARRGGTCGAVLNGANEAAVERFLKREIAFLDIAHCCRAVLNSHNFDPSPKLDSLMAADRWARQEVARWISQ